MVVLELLFMSLCFVLVTNVGCVSSLCFLLFPVFLGFVTPVGILFPASAVNRQVTVNKDSTTELKLCPRSKGLGDRHHPSSVQTYWCSRKKIQCFGYTDIWCCCSHWLANGLNLVQLLGLAQTGQGQGGTSSDGNRDAATFMLPNWDGSKSWIPSGLYSSFSVL